MNDEVVTVGRPDVLWRVERAGQPMIECLSAATADGRFRVWLVQEGWKEVSAVFVEPSEGVQWALNMERELVAQGWTKAP